MKAVKEMKGPEASAPAASSGPIEVRPLRSQEDFAACVRLQHEIWGEDYNEVVPPTMLKIVQKVGGVAAGAFDAGGHLLGCVFGLTGVDRGRIVHWSHLLAVVPEVRNSGLGRRLKAYQRDLLIPLGVEVMYWTFDPLFARNAHLNLTRLGAQVVEYVPDMYGRTGSSLHALGTDRFVVAWPVRAGSTAGDPAPMVETELFLQAPIANRDRSGDPASSDQPLAGGPWVRIEIPTDIEAIRTDSPGLAERWQGSVQRSFLWYLGQGYRVVTFRRDLEGGHGHYLLAAPTS